LTDLLGYRSALLVAAGVTLLGAILVLLWLPETRAFGHQAHPATTTADPAVTTLAEAPAAEAAVPARFSTTASAARLRAGAAPASMPAARDWLAHVTTLYSANRFVLAGIVSTTLGLLVQAHWPAWQSGTTGLGLAAGAATLTGLLLGVSTFVSGLAAPLAGHWSDRVPGRWPVVARLLLPGVLGAALLAVGAPPLVLIGVPFLAISAGSSQGLATTLLGDHALAAQRGRALGIMHTLGDFSSALAPILAYALLPYSGLPGLYVGCACICLAMAGWSWQLGRQRRL
jgi:MFS family permease